MLNNSSSHNKLRLDQALVSRNLATSRSQAESVIKLGKVRVGKRIITKPGFFVRYNEPIELLMSEQFVSRAGLKLKSVAEKLGVDFADKTVLDVGSSTGGFTDFVLTRGAKKVIAVDVGTDQMHIKLRNDPRVELHEQTDIRDFKTMTPIDFILIDVSFISLEQILPHIKKQLMHADTKVVAMAKPQFEAPHDLNPRGVIKNDTIRRQVLSKLEQYLRNNGWFIIDKADSEVAGAHGNRERFYLIGVAK